MNFEWQKVDTVDQLWKQKGLTLRPAFHSELKIDGQGLSLKTKKTCSKNNKRINAHIFRLVTKHCCSKIGYCLTWKLKIFGYNVESSIRSKHDRDIIRNFEFPQSLLGLRKRLKSDYNECNAASTYSFPFIMCLRNESPHVAFCQKAYPSYKGWMKTICKYWPRQNTGPSLKRPQAPQSSEEDTTEKVTFKVTIHLNDRGRVHEEVFL